MGTCSRHDMLTVLVKSSAEVGIVSLQAMVAGNDVGGHFLQRMADVRRRIRVINGGCNVVTFTDRVILMCIEHVLPLYFHI